MSVASIVFVLLMIAAVSLFARNARRIVRNINLGRAEQRNDRKGERWMLMTRVAMGQSKMVVRPIAGILHIIVYAGFVIINIEVLEIIIDGLFGTHRVFMRVRVSIRPSFTPTTAPTSPSPQGRRFCTVKCGERPIFHSQVS